MKRITLFIMVLLTMLTTTSFGQTTKIIEDKAKKWFENYYVPLSFKDPYSYKFMKIFSTPVTYKDSLIEMLNSEKINLAKDSSLVVYHEKRLINLKEFDEKKDVKTQFFLFTETNGIIKELFRGDNKEIKIYFNQLGITYEPYMWKISKIVPIADSIIYDTYYTDGSTNRNIKEFKYKKIHYIYSEDWIQILRYERNSSFDYHSKELVKTREKMQSRVTTINKITTEISKITKDDIIYHIIYLDCYGNNSYGNPILGQYIFYFRFSQFYGYNVHTLN
jgi:hypothetical protein